MAHAHTVSRPQRRSANATDRPDRPGGVSPWVFFACALVLAAGGTVFWWLEREPQVLIPTAADIAAANEAASARRMKLMREREAQARAEMERKEAEERARRIAVPVADGPTEAAAKKERDELARRQAAVAEEQRVAAETEAAWQRFYKPSAQCRDPAAATRVECVNEYVKAKRDFQAGLVARTN